MLATTDFDKNLGEESYFKGIKKIKKKHIRKENRHIYFSCSSQIFIVLRVFDKERKKNIRFLFSIP